VLALEKYALDENFAFDKTPTKTSNLSNSLSQTKTSGEDEAENFL